MAKHKLVSREPLLYLEFKKANTQNVYEINSFNKFKFCLSQNNCWLWLMSGMRNIKTPLIKISYNKHTTLLSDANVQSVSGHSIEQSTAHFSSRPTVFKLKCVSDATSNWFENHWPQRTHFFTVTNAPFRSKLESNGLQVDRNRKITERSFSTRTIFKEVSKLFGSLGCSDDKNWLDLSSIFFKISRFNSAFTVSFHSTRSDARVKFDSGVIFLDQSQFFATRSNQ